MRSRAGLFPKHSGEIGANHAHQHDHPNVDLDALLLSNILPSDHNSDFPLPKCQLVYAILTQVSVHVAQLISDAIYQFVGITPPRHLVDPEKSNRALGFPALITGLCRFYGVSITPTKLIQPPISRVFIKKYCMPRQAQQQEEGQH